MCVLGGSLIIQAVFSRPLPLQNDCVNHKYVADQYDDLMYGSVIMINYAAPSLCARLQTIIYIL